MLDIGGDGGLVVVVLMMVTTVLWVAFFKGKNFFLFFVLVFVVLVVEVVVFKMVLSALFWPTTPITTITQCTLNYSTPTTITFATIVAVIRMANVIVVGVVYLSICLVVGMVVRVEMGGGRWLLLWGHFF